MQEKFLKPEKLWRYFFEISNIPRCSGKEEGIVNYIENFARKNHLPYRKDNYGNIVVEKAPTPGYEDRPTVVLQSHLDMVCEKNSDVEHDFSKDPIEITIENGKAKARGTTLGADNGIGVAAMLSVLDSNDVKHGKLECLFTVEEEIGLKGAKELGDGMITGRYMINLDTEELGVIYIGCAGGIECKMPLEMRLLENLNTGDYKKITLDVSGLTGGHSGGDINKERANAIKLMGRLLDSVLKELDIYLVGISGGDKHNAIPRECSASFAVSGEMLKKCMEILNKTALSIKDEYKAVEKNLLVDIKESSLDNNAYIYDLESTVKLVNLLMAIPHGVLFMSTTVPGLVETSTNFAAVRSEKRFVNLFMSHRSSVTSRLEYVMGIHRALASLSGTEASFYNMYPAWQPDTGSRLLKIAKRAVKEVYGKLPSEKVIHAGLECAEIKRKYPQMDIISIGPTIRNPHSPDEEVDIKSVEIFWKILIEILESVYES